MPRILPVMAEDRGHGVLLSGGATQGLLITDLWRWNGAVWTQLQPAMLPYGRSGEAMVLDAHRDRVVLHGGNNDAFSWEWDGVTWEQVFRASPGIRVHAAIAYDSARRELVLFGGQNLLLPDTWVRRTPWPADVVPFGSGCPGSAGVPVLDHVAGSLPWIGDRLRMRATSLGTASVAFFVTGAGSLPPQDLGPLGLPGCDGLVRVDLFHLHAVVGGEADWGLNIPNAPALAGLRLYQQALVMDAGAPNGGAVSNAVEIVLGVR